MRRREFNRSKKIISAATLAAAAASVVGYVVPASAAVDTWVGSVADPSSGAYTLGVQGVTAGFATGATLTKWDTSTANWSNAGSLTGGKFTAGDSVVFTDNFSGGTMLELTSGSLNPTSMTFTHVGAVATTYVLLTSGDYMNAGANVNSSSPWGATGGPMTLTLDTGFNGTVVLRAEVATPTGTPSSFGGNTVVRSGTLEIEEVDALPQGPTPVGFSGPTAGRQNPTMTLDGGQLEVNANTRGNFGPGSSDLAGTLTVLSSSTISLAQPGSGAASARLWTGSINIASGATLTTTNLGTSTNTMQLVGLLTNSTGTLSLGSTVGTLSLQARSGTLNGSTGGIFDVGSAASVLTTSLATINLGALFGGPSTILRSNSAGSTNFSIGGRNDNSEFDGAITDNGSGSSNITKVGTGTFTLGGSSTFTGPLTVGSGTVVLSGALGSVVGTPTISVSTSSTATVVGTLRLDNTTNKTDRLGDTAAVILNRGNLEFVGNLATSTNEQTGTLQVTGGANNIKTIATGSGAPATLTFSAFSHTSGAINFDLNPSVNVNFTTAPTLSNGATGIIGGYATAATNDWATMAGNTVNVFTGYTTADGTNNLPASWTSTQDINLTTATQQVVGTSVAIDSLKLGSNGANDISISSGNVLTIGSGGILATGTGGATIEGSGTLTAGTGTSAATFYALVQDPNGVLTISAPIADNTAAGTVSLVKAGPGKLVLGGAGNSYTGSTSLVQGTLEVTKANFFGGTGSLTLNFNTALDVNGTAQSFTTINIINGSLLNSGAPATVTSSGSIGVQQGTVNVSLAGAGSLNKSSTNIVTLNASNSYTGGTNVTSGTLSTTVAGALSSAGSLSINGGGILDMGATNQTVTTAALVNGQLFGSGSLTATSYDLSGSNTFSSTAVLAGVGATLIKETTAAGTTNLGVATLSANNTYTGATTISGGTLNVNSINDGGLPSGIGASSSAAANLVLNGGTLAYVGNGGSTNRQLTLGSLASSTGIASNGAGPITFSFTGAITTLGSGTLVFTGSNTGSNTFLSDIPNTNTTNVYKLSGGTWVFPGVKNYTGFTRMDSGALIVDTLANGGQPSGIGASSNDPNNLQFNGGTLRYIGNGATIDRGFVIEGGNGAIIDSSGANTGSLVFSNNAGSVGTGTAGNTGNRIVTLTGTNTNLNTMGVQINNIGPVGGAVIYGVSKTGAGMWVFPSTNSYTGGTSVSNGTLLTNTNYSNGSLIVGGGVAKVLQRATSNSLSGTTVLLSNVGTLDTSGDSQATGTLNIGGTGQLDLTNNAMVVQYDPVNGSASPVSNVRNLLKAGFAGGAWNGSGATAGAIVSSAAAASTGSTRTALGYAESSDLTALTGAASFGGVAFGGPSMAPNGGTFNDVVVGYVYAGDANMDGNVNILDFNQIAANFGSSTAPSWIKGDLNYDGVVNALDLNAVATEFGDGPLTAPLPGSVALGSLVPEPTSIAALGMLAAVGTRRRRARAR